MTSEQPEPRPLHPVAARVQAALAAAGFESAVIEPEGSTRTSAEAATALGVEVAQIAKTLVFVADGEPVLVIAPGDRRVDTDKARLALGAATFERADPDTVREATGFAIGGVPPLGHPRPLRTLLDSGLARHDVLWAAGGTPRAVFPTALPALVEMTGGRVADVT